MILEDFTILGTTVPEWRRTDGRIFVCSAGISPTYGGLVRIYPLSWIGAPRRWRTYRVPVERNPKDSRAESFKISGDRSAENHLYINDVFQECGTMSPPSRMTLLSDYIVGSIKEANERRLSLAILQPEFGDIEFTPTNAIESPELSPFVNRTPTGAKAFPYIPRLHFDDDLGHHRLQIRDWGCFEWMRKHPGHHDELRSNLHLGSKSSLLVGNFCNQRTIWLIISILNGIRK